MEGRLVHGGGSLSCRDDGSKHKERDSQGQSDLCQGGTQISVSYDHSVLGC